MQIPLLHQQIILQTEKLRDLHRNLMMHAAPVPSSDLENFLREIRALYIAAVQLHNENAMQLLDEAQLAANQIVQVKESPVHAFQESNEKIPADAKGAGESVAHAAPNQDFVKRKPGYVEQVPSVQTFATKFEDHPTLGERIASGDSRKRVSENMRGPVNDLKKVIGLNEKFQFINQLFKGDAAQYHAAIESINASTTMEAAMAKVDEYSGANDWDSQAGPAKNFIEIIERRFSA